MLYSPPNTEQFSPGLPHFLEKHCLKIIKTLRVCMIVSFKTNKHQPTLVFVVVCDLLLI